MSLTARQTEPRVTSANVRLVLVDEQHQPRYLVHAAELERALLAAAEGVGVGPEDMPGLHGLCVEAVRAAERHSAQT